MTPSKAASAPTAADIANSDLSRLRQRLSGGIVLPGDDTYEDARRVWNGIVDKRPAAIVYCTTPDDVAKAISLARSRNLPLSVRSYGQNWVMTV